MYSSRAYVCDHGRQALRELILDIKVPLRDVVALGVRFHVRRAQFVRTDETSGNEGKRKSRTRRTPWITCRCVQRSILKEGSRLGRQKNELIRQRQNVEQPGSAPNGRSSVVEGIPRKSHAWLQVLKCWVREERAGTGTVIWDQRAADGQRVGKVAQVCDLAMNLRGHRRNFVSET